MQWHAIDTEYEVAPVPVPRLVSVAVAGPELNGLWHHNDPDAREAVRFTLARGWVGLMCPADIMAVWRRWPELELEILDAYEHDRVIDGGSCDKLICYAADEFAKKFGLDAVVKRRLGLEVKKGSDTFRLRYGELLDVPIALWPPEAKQYALDDPAYLYAVHVVQQRDWGHVLGPAPAIARKHLALYRQSLIGMAVDGDAVRQLERRLDEEIDRYTRDCIEHGLARIEGKKNPRVVRTEKAARAQLEALGIPLVRTDPTPKFPEGQVSLSEDALKIAKIPEGHPLDSYRRLGARTSLRTKFITPRRGPVVWTKYDELKITGRTGSAGFDEDDWRGPFSDNLQNQPKETEDPDDPSTPPIFRRCHIARPGRRLVVSDWGGAELVTLAQVQLDWFGRSRLAEVLREGRNPHEELACTILGIDRSRYDKSNPEHKQARQLAKVPNFGYPGGLGPRRFCDYALKEPYNLRITEPEARRLKAQWLETWPEMRLYFDYIDSLQTHEGITITGPRFGIVRGGASYTEACNFPFQGLAAAAAGDALWRLLRATLDPASVMHGSYQVLFVHDENVTEAPTDRAEAVCAEQERIMIEAFGRWCPDVPIKVESHIGERYEK